MQRAAHSHIAPQGDAPTRAGVVDSQVVEVARAVRQSLRHRTPAAAVKDHRTARQSKRARIVKRASQRKLATGDIQGAARVNSQRIDLQIVLQRDRGRTQYSSRIGGRNAARAARIIEVVRTGARSARKL